jgi:hypothetical protein
MAIKATAIEPSTSRVPCFAGSSYPIAKAYESQELLGRTEQALGNRHLGSSERDPSRLNEARILWSDVA